MKRILLAFSVFIFQSTFAQWNSQSAVNTPVGVAADMQYTTVAVTDGSGGTIIAWSDYRSGNGDVYIQRMNAAGVAQWTANGVAIANGSGDQYFPVLTADGAGGAYIVWTDVSTGTRDIYAQRVNASGIKQWAANGVAVCNAASDQYLGDAIPFGNGVLIAWGDNRTSTQTDVYAQYLDNTGAAQWTANGLLITNATREQTNPKLFSDAAGSAIIWWADYRNNNFDTYGQRILLNGTVQWAANGIALIATTGTQFDLQMVTDGAGGVIAVWEDSRNGSNTDVYAQRFNSSGTAQWTANGVVVSNAANYQDDPQLISDGAGGAIIVWQDLRNDAAFANRDVYAQRLDGSGNALWTANGVVITTATGQQMGPHIISDGSTGGIISWYDQRSGNYDIYAQKVNSSGGTDWSTNGVVVSNAANDQQLPVMVYSGNGNVILAWTDSRNDAGDIYATLLHSNGTLPVTLLSFEGSAKAVGNVLTWKTTNELNNDHFDIEKKAGNIFVKIGVMQASHNNTNASAYSFTDVQPGKDDMYRLKQVNNDGSFMYSKTIRIIQSNNAGKLTYQNPVSSALVLTTDLRGELRITDMNGRVMLKQVIKDQQTNIATGPLAPGNYMMCLDGVVTKFVKL